MDDKTLAQMIAALVTEENALLARLTKVRTARATLESLQSDDPVEFDGKLSDACRSILKTSTKSWSPVEIREQLRVIGYDLSKHRNEMAAIHGVLKRIKESGDADTKEAKDGSGVRYFWKGVRATALSPLIGTPPPGLAKVGEQIKRALEATSRERTAFMETLKVNPLTEQMLKEIGQMEKPSSELSQALETLVRAGAFLKK